VLCPTLRKYKRKLGFRVASEEEIAASALMSVVSYIKKI
jgi:hypothetical protein